MNQFTKISEENAIKFLDILCLWNKGRRIQVKIGHSILQQSPIPFAEKLWGERPFVSESKCLKLREIIIKHNWFLRRSSQN